MASQKSPFSCVVAIFQNLDILMYAVAAEKPFRLEERIF
jgi:hypothetical protein